MERSTSFSANKTMLESIWGPQLGCSGWQKGYRLQFAIATPPPLFHIPIYASHKGLPRITFQGTIYEWSCISVSLWVFDKCMEAATALHHPSCVKQGRGVIILNRLKRLHHPSVWCSRQPVGLALALGFWGLCRGAYPIVRYSRYQTVKFVCVQRRTIKKNHYLLPVWEVFPAAVGAA